MMRFHLRQPVAPAETTPAVGHEAADAAHGLYRLGLGYGQLVHRLRWLILLLWLAVLAASVPFAGHVASVLRGGGFQVAGSESSHVDNLLQARLHIPPSQAVAVFQSAHAQVRERAYRQELHDFMMWASTLLHVIGVRAGGLSRDGRTTFVEVDFNQNDDTTQQHIANVRTLLGRSVRDGPARAYLVGTPARYDELNTIIETDSKKAESVALPIALVVLLIVFGTVLAALMPLLLALVTVPVALALLYAIALHTWTSDFVLNVASIIGLGISIDYSLFMTRRFREELRLGRSAPEAMAWTVATTGVAIFFSGLTVMIGFAGLFLIGIPFMTSFGIGGAVVVGVALVAALTLLPALLVVLGPRLNALRLPFLSRLTAPAHGVPAHAERSSAARPGASGAAGAHERHGFWHAWALAVMRQPALIILASVLFLAAAGWPIFSLNPAAYGGSTVPANTESQQGLAILSAAFPQTKQNPIFIVAATPDGSSMLAPPNLSRLDSLTRWVAAQSHITGVTGLMRLPRVPDAPALSAQQLVQVYTTGAYASYAPLAQFVASTTTKGLTLVTATSNTQLDSPAGKALITSLRAGEKAAGRGLTVSVGGLQARSVDFSDYLYATFPKVILVILLATYVLLLVMFRSLLLPLKAVLVNVLSLSATYGVLVFVFQWGHFQDALGFTSRGNIDATIPVLIYCVLFGLSMDYEVFLLSRIREEWLRTHDNHYAVARGLEKTGGVITNAALLYSIVSGAFVFTSLLPTKELGLGMTVAVLVDATVIRALLVPATMCLLGRWNWWLPGQPLPVERAARDMVGAGPAEA